MVSKFKAPGNFGGGDRYVLHTDDPTLRKDNKARLTPDGEGWGRREHPEGVTEHVHEYGSSLYVTHAKSRKEAADRIAKAEARTNEINKREVEARGYNTLFENPKFAFSIRKDDPQSKVKPRVIPGGKKDE